MVSIQPAKKEFQPPFQSLWQNIGLAKEKAYLIENLGLLLSSGMTIHEALLGVSKGVQSFRMKSTIAAMRAAVDAGAPLWQVMRDSHLFPDHAVALIRLGEDSGNLVENLKVLGSREEKERNFSSKVRSAVMYPLFVLVLTVSIGTAIAWFILPQLSTVFSSLNLPLPIVTRALMAFGNFLGEYGSVAVPLGVLFVAFLAFIIFFYKKTRFLGQYFIMSLPGFRQLVIEVELARFGYLLGTLLQARLSIVQALSSMISSTENPLYKKLYKHLKSSIDEGHGLYESLEGYRRSEKIIPAPVQQLLAAGERSGALAPTLTKIGEAYEAKAEISTKNLAVMLEPILLVIVWVGVVSVALAVILPIYSLIGGLNSA